MPGETISAFTPSQALRPGQVGERDAVGLRLRPRRRAVVPGDHLGAARPQRRDRRPARPPQPEHRHLVAGVAADPDHGSGPASAASSRAATRSCIRHR